MNLFFNRLIVCTLSTLTIILIQASDSSLFGSDTDIARHLIHASIQESCDFFTPVLPLLMSIGKALESTDLNDLAKQEDYSKSFCSAQEIINNILSDRLYHSAYQTFIVRPSLSSFIRAEHIKRSIFLRELQQVTGCVINDRGGTIREFFNNSLDITEPFKIYMFASIGLQQKKVKMEKLLFTSEERSHEL